MTPYCEHNPPNLPPVGLPYSTAYCRFCWLAKYDPRFAVWIDGKPLANTAHKPLSAWPLTARLIARLRSDADAGLGDTIARHLARFGGDAWKRLYKKLTGSECGCANRQAALNSLYPYPKDAQD